jgi:mannose-6-phosphate isomerase
MFYPFKFQPVYKDYIWGGRNFEKLGKTLPKGIVAESWEVSCHPDGVSIIENGEFRGVPLPSMVDIYGRTLVGTALPEKDLRKFPLLVKFIDANKDLSVQVHPDDIYANAHESGEYGKNEMWYIMSAEPGAKLIYDVVPGTTRESFRRAVEEDNIEHCLKSMEVFPGDVINIPSGLIHAIGKGILLAEVQQNSNTTYRVYDYNRTDKNGSKRPLHIGKALDVIDFDASGRKEKYRGLEISAGADSSKKFLIANSYFSVELYIVSGVINEEADGSRFHIYTFIDGEGEITYESGCIKVKFGESVLIPASMGKYQIHGSLKALKSYVPDLKWDVWYPLIQAGFAREKILENVGGLQQKL